MTHLTALNLDIETASRPGIFDDSDVEGAVTPGKPYATHVNGRLVLARDLPSKRKSTGPGLLGETFGIVRTSKALTKRVKSCESLKDNSTPLLAATPYNPPQQIPHSTPIPQVPFPAMVPFQPSYSMPIPQAQFPPMAPMPLPALRPPPMMFPYPGYSGPPPGMLSPTTPSFPQFLPMPLYPPGLPQPLPGRYAVPIQARNISQPAAAFRDLIQIDDDFRKRSSSEPLKIKNLDPANEASGDNSKITLEEKTTVTITKHVCANCGRIRSRRYHRDNPLKPGENPVSGFCHKCQRDESSLSGKEGNGKRQPNKLKKYRKIKHSSPPQSARSSSVEAATKRKKEKRRYSRYDDHIIEENLPEERSTAEVKVSQIKDSPRRVSSSENSSDEESLSDQESLPRTQSRQPEVVIDRRPKIRRSFQRRSPVVHFDEHSPIRIPTTQQRASPLGSPKSIPYRTVLATPVYEDEVSHRPQIHRREPFGLRSTDAQTISRDEDYRRGSASSYPRNTRTENRRGGRSYARDHHEISSHAVAAPEEAREVQNRVRIIDPLASQTDEKGSRSKSENPGFEGQGNSEKVGTKFRHWNFKKGKYEKVHEYRSLSDSSESDSRNSDHKHHDFYRRDTARRSYRRNESVDDLASTNSSLEFWRVNRLARQNLSPKPLRRYMTPSPPRQISESKIPPKAPTPPRHQTGETHQPEVGKLSPPPLRRPPSGNWTDGQYDSYEYSVSSLENAPPTPSTKFKKKAKFTSSPSTSSSQEASPSIGSYLRPNDASPKPTHKRRMSNGRPAFGREATDNGTELLHMSIFEAKITSPPNSDDSLHVNHSQGPSTVVDTHRSNTELTNQPSSRCPPPPSYLHKIPDNFSDVEYIPADNDSSLKLLTSKNLRRSDSDLRANEETRRKRSSKATETQGESSTHPSAFDIGGWSNWNGTWGLKPEFDFGDNQDCWED
ncbi:hypothetical protein CJF31_00008058 [Rutstroemia sp. NJR-2017a BVV2]|nr:hypothetical protein CJF31_00008058 [Rutstroemia sp. NJR-2017a BVV2]